MIKSIKMTGYQIFEDTELNGCEKYNLIFGYNGTGKSTLTKLLKELESNPDQLTSEKYTVKLEKDEPLNIKVYHGANYIEENITKEKEDDNFIFFTIGKDFKELKYKQKNILAEIETYKKELTNIKLHDINKDYTDIARKIREQLKLGEKEFDRNHVKNKYDLNIIFSKIEDNKYYEISSKANSIETKKIINKINNYENKFELLKNNLATLLLKQIEKPIEISNEFQKITDRYNADKDLQIWIQNGLKYSIYTDEKECPFCSRNLDIKISETINLFQEFENYFNNKELKIKEELKNIKNQADIYFNELEKIVVPNIVDFFQEEQNEVDILIKNIEEKYRLLNKVYKTYTDLIEEKMNLPYDIINKDIPNFTDCINELNKNIDKINTIINEHNKRVDNSKEEKDKAKENIINHILAENQENIINIKKNIDIMNGNKSNLEKDIEIKNENLKLIQQEIKNIKTPIEEFNENLRIFIGRDNIKLQYDEAKQSYNLIRDNEDASKSLSEGERTIIALVHFISTLKHKKEKSSKLKNNEVNIDDENNDLSNCVVVIDDPISSLDSNFVYNAYAYLHTKLTGCKQIFILTHHFYFFKRIQKWFIHTEGKNHIIKQIVRTDNSSKIEDINTFLISYETEYQYIYDKIQKLKEKCSKGETLTDDEKISLPNECRKIFESAVSFLYPFENNYNTHAARVNDIIKSITENIKVDERDKYMQCLNYIYRYSNTESHLQNFDCINLHLKNDEESYNLIKYIIIFIEEYVPIHLKNYNIETLKKT